MKAHKITDEEIADYKISALPTRPTAPAEYGGKGFTAKEMREAFDKLSLYVIEIFNDLIDDLETESSDSVIHTIKLGYDNGMTLFDFVTYFVDGRALSIIPMGEESLSAYLLRLRTDLNECMSKLGIGE